jgi:hypothetical protein
MRGCIPSPDFVRRTRPSFRVEASGASNPRNRADDVRLRNPCLLSGDSVARGDLAVSAAIWASIAAISASVALRIDILRCSIATGAAGAAGAAGATVVTVVSVVSVVSVVVVRFGDGTGTGAGVAAAGVALFTHEGLVTLPATLLPPGAGTFSFRFAAICEGMERVLFVEELAGDDCPLLGELLLGERLFGERGERGTVSFRGCSGLGFFDGVRFTTGLELEDDDGACACTTGVGSILTATSLASIAAISAKRRVASSSAILLLLVRCFFKRTN